MRRTVVSKLASLCTSVTKGTSKPFATSPMSFTYRYPRPAVTVDTIIVARSPPKPRVLLIERKHDPFAGSWALPGGFVDENEPLDAAARREAAEETGIAINALPELIQVAAFGNPGRDPRGWTISVAFATTIPETVSVEVSPVLF